LKLTGAGWQKTETVKESADSGTLDARLPTVSVSSQGQPPSARLRHGEGKINANLLKEKLLREKILSAKKKKGEGAS
jgi:hypothetical protein